MPKNLLYISILPLICASSTKLNLQSFLFSTRIQRNFIIDVVSVKEGHLASLGVIELTIAFTLCI
jgi:deoxyxylulose-5-phosphate synthase